MNLSSSANKDVTSLSAKVKVSPVGWLKGLIAESEANTEMSNEYKDLALSLSIDSNVTLSCLDKDSEHV